MSSTSVPDADLHDHASDGVGTSASDQTQSSIASVLTKVKDHFGEYQGIAPLNQIITFVTNAYLAEIDPEQPPKAAVIEQQLLALVNGVIVGENAKAKGSPDLKSMRLSTLKTLTAGQVANVMLHVHRIVKVTPSDDPEASNTDEYDPLVMYQASGRGRGTYTANEEVIRAAARKYNAQLTLNEFREIRENLREEAERTTTCQHRDLIAVKNGVFHDGNATAEITINGKDFVFEPKTLHAFDPALVFMSKSHVAYVKDAPPVFITAPDDTVWEVRDWIRELSDDEGVPELLWELLGAIIRPHVRWGKSAWFYSEQGNNGKGTLCSLMRNLVGAGAHTSIPLSDFGKEFALEPLINAMAIIVDENNVGDFIDKAANFKAVVTGDIIQINRKHVKPIAYKFEGFMVQCINELPRFKDKSESNYRRQLIVPFKKWFGGGAERPYIKDDYLKRPDVLEYVLWYVLHEAGAETPGEYYTLSTPEATMDQLTEYKEVNDPVRAFWAEFKDRFVWSLLPFTFLYDLYKAWYPTVSPSGSPVSRQQFVTNLMGIIVDDPEWHCPDKNRKFRPGDPATGLMSAPEHLIADYDLKDWKNPAYPGTEPDKISIPILKPQYRGVLRTVPQSGTDNTADEN